MQVTVKYVNDRYKYILRFLDLKLSSCLHHLWRWNWQSVPKRRHIKVRRREIIQKKEYNKLRYCKFYLCTVHFEIYVSCVCTAHNTHAALRHAATSPDIFIHSFIH